MRIAFIETSSLTNEVLRAYAGAHRLCCGYPDGVPETWRTVSAAQQEGGAVPDLPMKHFTDETRGCPGGKPDLAALMGPVTTLRSEALDWLLYLQGKGTLTAAERAKEAAAWREIGYPERGGVGDDPAALLGPAAEPVDWPEWQREALRKILAEDDYPLGGIPSDDEDSAGDWPERDAAGDEEC